MSRPVVIVDPLSSGIELAPTFKARGIPAIAVTLKTEEWPEFGSKMQASDFVAVIPDQPGIEDLIKKYDPIAIIPGTEEGIPLAERLTEMLTPHFANDPKKSLHRSHKSLMQQALHEAGVPALKTLHTSSVARAEAWIIENDLENAPLILKPAMSSGSEMVFHISAGDEWKHAFHQILNEPSVLTGKKNETVVIQEQAIGTEYAVGTISANGKHHLVHLIKYTKISGGGRKTVYDHVEFVPYDKNILGDLFEYTQKSLDALGVRWGATHTEIMMTEKGPRLIESSARMIGGPVVGFARAATGSSQADKLVEIYIDGDVLQKDYIFKKTVVPVFLKAVNAGTISNIEVFNAASELPTLLFKYIWVENGQHVPQTIDYLTAIGIIALSGNRDAIFSDYEKIRAMESKLIVKSNKDKLTNQVKSVETKESTVRVKK
jgi:biotin carboxylase